MATEICYLTLKEDVDLFSPTPESKVWQAALKIISEQDGYQGQYWGKQMEYPEVIVLFIGAFHLPPFSQHRDYPNHSTSLTTLSRLDFPSPA